MARVAICVPCWNQLAYTKRMVESVQRHSGGHEIAWFFVDNGSTDGTLAYLMSVSALVTDGGIVVIVTESVNRGVNPAWNDLLALVRGEAAAVDVVCLMNNDLIVSAGWLDPVVEAIAKDGERAYFLANGGPFTERDFEAEARETAARERGRRVPGRAGWCMFFAPSAIAHFHPIPDELVLWYGDDWIHWQLETQRGYAREVLLDCCVLHFGSKSVNEYEGKVERVAKDREAFRRLTGWHDVP